MIGTAAKLRFGLSDIEGGRIIILDEAPTGDVLLDEALMSMEDVSSR